MKSAGRHPVRRRSSTSTKILEAAGLVLYGLGTRGVPLVMSVDVNDRLGEGLRSFLRQIVPYAAGDEAVLVFAREPVPIRSAGRVDCTVGVALHGDRGHGDGRKCGQPLF